MTEVEFVRLIDGRFPYSNLPRALDLIHRGAAISTNAAFCVLDEICRPPASVNVTPESQTELVGQWRRHITHPLAEPLAECARKIVAGRRLRAPECLNLLELVAAYPGQYAALSVVNAAYDAPPAGLDVVAEMTDAIRAAWEAG
jgi:hypothetical protein